MSGANDAERDAWLSEMWSYCRELPRHERVTKRAQDRREQREIEERRTVHSFPEDVHRYVGGTPTGSPEIAPENVDKGAA